MLTIAETVRAERKKNADFDNVAVGQYKPRMQDAHLAVPNSARGANAETESGGTTARDLLSDKDTAAVRLDDMQDGFGPQNLNGHTTDSVGQH